jgi:hypothetical protein
VQNIFKTVTAVSICAMFLSCDYDKSNIFLKYSKNDLTELNLSGKVKSLTEISYEVSNGFWEGWDHFNIAYDKIKFHKTYDPIADTGRYTIADTNTHVKYLFDSTGNKRIVRYYKHNKVSKTDSIFYLENGFIIKTKSFDSTGKLTSVSKSQYDKDGNNIANQVLADDNDKNIIFSNKSTYNKKGNRVSYFNYVGQGNLNGKTFYKYDSVNNVIGECSYYYDGTFISVSKYTYDNKGNKITYKDYDYLNGKKLIQNRYMEYDDKGNMTKETKYYINGELPSETTYKYEYDNKGNWIKKKEISHNILIKITERIIEYF